LLTGSSLLSECRVPDAIFAEQRLADIYDALDPARSDRDAYLAVADELNARSVLDLGCGTGTFACLLAERGRTVTGIDPAAASLHVARRKAFAEQVRWLYGEVESLAPLQVDLVTMTGNVAQVFVTDARWASALRAARRLPRPGPRPVLVSRMYRASGRCVLQAAVGTPRKRILERTSGSSLLGRVQGMLGGCREMQ